MWTWVVALLAVDAVALVERGQRLRVAVVGAEQAAAGHVGIGVDENAKLAVGWGAVLGSLACGAALGSRQRGVVHTARVRRGRVQGAVPYSGLTTALGQSWSRRRRRRGVSIRRARPQQADALEAALDRGYQYGFSTTLETETIAAGLSEATIREISKLKGEPDWLLQFRLRAFQKWQSMPMPDWANLALDPIDFQQITYYSAPKNRPKKGSMDEVDPELRRTFEKLGIPLSEQKRLANVAVDVVFDSESIATTFRKELQEAGVIFCSMGEAVREYPDLVKKYLGRVVPIGDNYFAALNSAVFSDGTFVYVPKGVKCPMDLSTYFRINDQASGQFERTLIVAEEAASVSYLEGCTAPMYDTKQLHAAVVELLALDDASIKYSTVQNWYSGDEEGRGGILNFVTKRGMCAGDRSRIVWAQVETGSAVTWKYPSCILQGADSTGEFYSVAVTRGVQQADTGTKMIHVGPRTTSKIISKGISADRSTNTYRGLVAFTGRRAQDCRAFSQCDSLLVGDRSLAATYPVIEAQGVSNVVEHEASTGKVSDEQLFYLRSRGLSTEQAVSLILQGFCSEVFETLPLEFAAEAGKLLAVKLEGAVG